MISPTKYVNIYNSDHVQSKCVRKLANNSKTSLYSIDFEEAGAIGGMKERVSWIPPAEQGANRPSAGGEIRIGSITLQVVPGDLIKERTDAIVNGTNNNLDFSMGSVSYFLPPVLEG